MSLFDAAYDAMSWEEISYRLPGELAVKALKRRIINLDTLFNFFASCGTNANGVKDVKEHVNIVLAKYSAQDILTKFSEEHHPTLFGWVNDANKTRLKKDGKAQLTTKFLFNMTDEKDGEGLEEVLDRVLSDVSVKPSAVLSVLRKANLTVFPQLINKIIRDKRNEVKCCVLSVGDDSKRKLLGNNMLLVGLKAFAKSGVELGNMDLLDFNLIASLRPGERLSVLKKYLSMFPLYHKRSAFVKDPTDEELDLTLFAGCIDQNDLVVELKDLYNKITKEDKPKDA